MIKATIDKGRIMVAAQGSTFEITSEVCHLISAIYQQFDDNSGKNSTREAFRTSLVHILTDPDSPLFIPMDKEAEV